MISLLEDRLDVGRYCYSTDQEAGIGKRCWTGYHCSVANIQESSIRV